MNALEMQVRPLPGELNTFQGLYMGGIPQDSLLETSEWDRRSQKIKLAEMKSFGVGVGPFSIMTE